MLKLSQKGSYAIRAILYIAQIGKIVKVSKIAETEKIPESLLRRLIADLEKKDILHTIKGRNGGVQLGKEANEISVYDILNAIGEELGIRDCTKGLSCLNHENCTTTKLYNNLQTGFNSLLKMNTIDKLIK